MGRQIQVLQSFEDAQELHRLINAKFGLLSLPEPRSKKEKPVPAGAFGRNRKVLFFGEQFHGAVLKNTQNGPGGTLRIIPCKGICLEWLNTVDSPVGLGKLPGRYYFRTDPAYPESNAFLNKVLSFIVRKIKTTYPKRNDEPHPAYAGPHFLNAVKQGKFDPGWKLIKNPDFKPPRSAK